MLPFGVLFLCVMMQTQLVCLVRIYGFRDCMFCGGGLAWERGGYSSDRGRGGGCGSQKWYKW